ncbi:3-keto-disaccharide hydrolase [Maribacter sp. 2-571]|uniref:3-keto-disaccharide hydrolase n=1 Tax=Maribacter sp. 2-571 TaxID=3417569 RepID=UPI003D347C98
MKTIFSIACSIMLLFVSCKEQKKEAVSSAPETEAQEVASTDTDQEWTVLFDGSSFDGWKAYGGENVPDHWKLEDGAMVFYPPENREEGATYNLITEKRYTDFELSLEWKISEAGNSGIFWGVMEKPSLKQPYESGPEIQVLDNAGHPDGKNGTTHQAGALYDMIAPSKDVTKAVGEWNTCIVSIDHKTQQGSVVLNGEKIVTFPVNNDAWNALVSGSKFADWEHFGKYTTGSIGLQDHGDKVAFRNIKIKEL